MTNLDCLYDSNTAREVFDENRFIDKKLGFQVIENGMILPQRSTGDDGKTKGGGGYGGIVDSNGEFVKESFIHYGTGGKYTPPHHRFCIVQIPSSI